MLFYEPLFVTFFLAFYALYLQARRAFSKKWALLIASLLFYLWGEPVFVLVLLVSTAIDYALSFHLNASTPGRSRRLALAAGIAGNLGILIIYKYADFLIGNLNLAALAVRAAQIGAVAPGAADRRVVRGVRKDHLSRRHLARRLAAGGILRRLLPVRAVLPKIAGRPDPQISRDEGPDRLAAGDRMGRYLCGLPALCARHRPETADRRSAGRLRHQIFAADPATIGPGFAWLGLACFTLQIYFDFAGYSDMAIGLARTLGFRLKENFNSPYVSQSLTEFWRRWHISLTTWIRDYLYIPLGGGRRGEARTYINLWICFLASGLWHGASWNFVLWGAYNGLFLTLDRLFLRDALARCGKLVATAVTLFIVMIGWAIFRSENTAHIAPYLAALFGKSQASGALEVPPEIPLALVLGAVISLFPATRLYPWLVSLHEKHVWLRVLTIAVLLVIYLLALARAFAVPFQPFIYFRF